MSRIDLSQKFLRKFKFLIFFEISNSNALPTVLNCRVEIFRNYVMIEEFKFLIYETDKQKNLDGNLFDRRAIYGQKPR